MALVQQGRVAIEALPVMVLDNVTGTLRSASLAAALTTTSWRDRLMGTNQIPEVPLMTTWICTGNNISFGSDIARRVIPITIDPETEDPEARTGFQYPNLR